MAHSLLLSVAGASDLGEPPHPAKQQRAGGTSEQGYTGLG